MDVLYTNLMEFGAMGLFAAFLVWQHLNMQKRLDSLLEKFQQQLTAIQDKAEANEDKLRARYDIVLEQYRGEYSTFRESVASQVTESIRAIENIKKTIGTLPLENLQIQIEGLSLNQRNSHLVLVKVMEIMKKMEEEQKIRAMAKRLSEQDK